MTEWMNAVSLPAVAGIKSGNKNSYLSHSQLEPGTAEAFRGYISCLHQLYLAGMCVQLHRLGYDISPAL